MLALTENNSSRAALQAIVAAQGNIEVAAEILHTSPSALIAAIVVDENNYDTLQKYLRTFSLIRSFTLLDSLHTALTSELAEGSLRGREIAKAYTDTAALVDRLTDNHTTTTNVNVFETVMKTLPPRVQS